MSSSTEWQYIGTKTENLKNGPFGGISLVLICPPDGNTYVFKNFVCTSDKIIDYVSIKDITDKMPGKEIFSTKTDKKLSKKSFQILMANLRQKHNIENESVLPIEYLVDLELNGKKRVLNFYFNTNAKEYVLSYDLYKKV